VSILFLHFMVDLIEEEKDNLLISYVKRKKKVGPFFL